MATSAIKKLGCGVCCLGSVVVIILIIASFSSLGATEVGLDYSAWSKSVHPNAYKSGLHFIGAAHHFIRYPTTLQSIVFSQDNHNLLKTRTSDGLPITLGASFQYRYQPGNLYALYQMYGGSEAHIFENTATHIINVAATNYTAYQFFNDKQGIATDMLKIMSEFFSAELLVSVEALQLTQTQLPQSFEDAIQETINIQQNITQVQKQQRNMAVKLRTALIAAEQNKQARISLAKGEASQILQSAQARANATARTLDTEARSYAFIDQHLNISKTDKSQLLAYIYWDAIGNLEEASGSSQFLVGVHPNTLVEGH